jgi:hypothetical protein
LALLLANQDQTPQWKGTIKNEGGIKIIRNPEKPIHEANIFSSVEDLKIGEIDGDKNYMFSRIRILVVDNNETIYVADSIETHIKIFNKNGEFIKVFGKPGQGPGEIGRIRSMQLTSNSELLILDSSNRKILYFSLGGDFIRSKDHSKTMAMRAICDSHENFYVVTAVLDPPNTRYELLKYDKNFNLTSSISKIPAPDPSKPLNPFAPIFYFLLMDNDCLLYGYPKTYELQVFNPKGNIIKRITKDYTPVVIPETAKEERLEGIRPGRKVDFPRHYPAYRNFTMDDKGRIYVQSYEKSNSDNMAIFDVFDANGRYIAKIQLDFRPLVIKKGKMYSIVSDEEGFQYVKRYKITWNY